MTKHGVAGLITVLRVLPAGSDAAPIDLYTQVVAGVLGQCNATDDELIDLGVRAASKLKWRPAPSELRDLLLEIRSEKSLAKWWVDEKDADGVVRTRIVYGSEAERMRAEYEREIAQRALPPAEAAIKFRETVRQLASDLAMPTEKGA